ncbi:MAG: hypothetical protein HYY54_05475 [candidate division NC10 bacterium]|nr:hypothetical protein [candidate division NC10 bacterium]
MTAVEIVRALGRWDRRLKRMRLRSLQVPEEAAARLRPALHEVAAAFEAARSRWEAGRVLTLGPPPGLLAEMDAALERIASAYARHRATFVALGLVDEGEGEKEGAGTTRGRPSGPPVAERRPG